MRDRDGNPVHAVFGFARFLGDLIERVRPAYMAVAFDQRRAHSPTAAASIQPTRPTASARRRISCCSSSAVGSCAGTSGSRYSSIRTMKPTTSSARSRASMRDAGVRSAYITRDKDLAQLMRDGDLFWDFGARGSSATTTSSATSAWRPNASPTISRSPGTRWTTSPVSRASGIAPRPCLMKAFGSLDELYADLARVARLPLRGAATFAARLAAHRDSVYLARRSDAHRLRPVARRRRRGHCGGALPDLPALAELYDRLGFGPLPAPPGRAPRAASHGARGAERRLSHGVIRGAGP